MTEYTNSPALDSDTAFLEWRINFSEDTMKEQIKERQKLKGIGGVLSPHLVESNDDTMAGDEEVHL